MGFYNGVGFAGAGGSGGGAGTSVYYMNQYRVGDVDAPVAGTTVWNVTLPTAAPTPSPPHGIYLAVGGFGFLTLGSDYTFTQVGTSTLYKITLQNGLVFQPNEVYTLFAY